MSEPKQPQRLDVIAGAQDLLLSKQKKILVDKIFNEDNIKLLLDEVTKYSGSLISEIEKLKLKNQTQDITSCISALSQKLILANSLIDYLHNMDQNHPSQVTLKKIPISNNLLPEDLRLLDEETVTIEIDRVMLKLLTPLPKELRGLSKTFHMQNLDTIYTEYSSIVSKIAMMKTPLPKDNEIDELKKVAELYPPTPIRKKISRQTSMEEVLIQSQPQNEQKPLTPPPRPPRPSQKVLEDMYIRHPELRPKVNQPLATPITEHKAITQATSKPTAPFATGKGISSMGLKTTSKIHHDHTTGTSTAASTSKNKKPKPSDKKVTPWERTLRT